MKKIQIITSCKSDGASISDFYDLYGMSQTPEPDIEYAWIYSIKLPFLELNLFTFISFQILVLEARSKQFAHAYTIRKRSTGPDKMINFFESNSKILHGLRWARIYNSTVYFPRRARRPAVGELKRANWLAWATRGDEQHVWMSLRRMQSSSYA